MLKQRYQDYINRENKDESFDDSLKIKKKIVQNPSNKKQNNNQAQQKQNPVLNINQTHKIQQTYDKSQANNNNKNIFIKQQNLLQFFNQNYNNSKLVFNKDIVQKNDNSKTTKQTNNEKNIIVISEKNDKEKVNEKVQTGLVAGNLLQNNSQSINQFKIVGKQQNVIVLDEIEQKLDSYSQNRNKNLDFYGIDKVTFENDKKEKVLQSLQQSDIAKIQSLSKYKQLIKYFQYDQLKPQHCSIAYQKIFCLSLKNKCQILKEEDNETFVQARKAKFSKNLITIKHNPKVFIKVVGFLNNFHRNEDDPRIYHPSVQSKFFKYIKQK
ncbi:hypothetical protein ABPG72_010403 [Tetrahymena utriculariae]